MAGGSTNLLGAAKQHARAVKQFVGRTAQISRNPAGQATPCHIHPYLLDRRPDERQGQVSTKV
ncbi:hypothetical protein D4764_06G0007680 [Takifugu flavidus]|uniref:Uncharacterized protein n=1 Tax=Takifugu flavidus TaxID=433684 RepID=A0A5C6MXW9_9TELE|nr:hypothetical protein D4764_06G0007680 [Takifugu flavidus]